MFLLYVDESGDSGIGKGSSALFVLSGLVVHELRWRQTAEALVQMRRGLREKYGVKLREEIHAVDLIQSPRELRRIDRWKRLRILWEVAVFQAGLQDISVINVVVDKSRNHGSDVFSRAWTALVTRFYNTMSHRNFPGPHHADDRGIVLTDATEGQKLRRLVRRLRRYNPVPHNMNYGTGYRQIPLDTLIEDPVERDSRHSLFIQCCDVNAYLLTQKLRPNKFFRKRGARNYFDRLDPVLCKMASASDPQGIVRL
jgi:hypothetical protein